MSCALHDIELVASAPPNEPRALSALTDVSTPPSELDDMPAPRGALIAKRPWVNWPTYLLVLIVMMANSLQGTALSLRLATLNYPAVELGFIISSAYAGLLVGPRMTSVAIHRWGARTCFLTSVTMVAGCVLLLGPAGYWLFLAGLRFAIGIGLAFFYVVIESELNARATARSRATVMSFYMAAVFFGMMAGQPLLVISDPLSLSSYLIASAAALLAVVVAAITPRFGRASVEPSLEGSWLAGDGLWSLPLIGCFCMGISQGAFFGVGPVFAHDVGFSKDAVALFMFCGVFAGGLMQYPVGRFADQFGRMKVAVACVLASLVTCVASLDVIASGADPTRLTVLVAIWGGSIMPVYSLLLAEANEGLNYRQMVAVSGRLITAFGFGAIAGPLGSSMLIDFAGPNAFYVSLACAAMVLFVVMVRQPKHVKG